MNTLRESVQDYLQLRRHLGFKLEEAGLQLPRFVTFLEANDATYITTALALSWAQQPEAVLPAEWARRLGYVRGFARYRSAVDGRTQVPPPRLLPHRSTRARPYLYSDEEVQALLAAALKLPTSLHATPLRPWVFYCLLGLLSTTGLRMSEALGLHVADLNLEEEVLTIRRAKLGRIRLVPLHASTTAVLADYLRRRHDCFGGAASPYLFVSNRAPGSTKPKCTGLLRPVAQHRSARATASHGPRLHDFRHRFALRVLTRWYEAGEDAARRLPVLSAYLGHVNVADTYWYLSAWPELMGQAMSRLEQRWGAASDGRRQLRRLARALLHRATDAAASGQRAHDRFLSRRVQDAAAVRPEAAAQGAVSSIARGCGCAPHRGVLGSSRGRARRDSANAQSPFDGSALVLPFCLV